MAKKTIRQSRARWTFEPKIFGHNFRENFFLDGLIFNNGEQYSFKMSEFSNATLQVSKNWSTDVQSLYDDWTAEQWNFKNKNFDIKFLNSEGQLMLLIF